ncbi:MAG: repressor LexA [Deltaproteobacteria bacterium RBG_16_48_10]|nr:MAG: repressor LexA [Deltaproteobacteria bacterium RBG_16_48_10]
MELTARQEEIFSFIRTFIKERGYPPSVREMGEHFHIYPRAVFDHLKALERKGYLKRRGSMSRGLEILVFQGSESYGLPQREAGYGEHSKKERRSPIREIPILGRVTAGKPILAIEHVEGTIPFPADWVRGKEVFLLKVKGDSMSPYILPDDYVVVRSQSSAENRDVVVTLLGEEATVKRFFKKGKRIELKPDNERWETIRIEESSGEVQILGKVTGIFRKC